MISSSFRVIKRQAALRFPADLCAASEGKAGRYAPTTEPVAEVGSLATRAEQLSSSVFSYCRCCTLGQSQSAVSGGQYEVTYNTSSPDNDNSEVRLYTTQLSKALLRGSFNNNTYIDLFNRNNQNFNLFTKIKITRLFYVYFRIPKKYCLHIKCSLQLSKYSKLASF